MSGRISKRLAYALRHRPDAFGITLDAHGWAAVDTVLIGLGLQLDELRAVVEAPGRRRFEIDGGRVRALHGHSVGIEVDHAPAVPPAILFHGTVAAALRAIRAEGLVRGSRTHVHLTASIDEARAIGARRGPPVIVEVRARALHDARAIPFLHVAPGGIWLVDHVPPEYLVIPG